MMQDSTHSADRIEHAAISARYPAATFRLVRAADDPRAYHLLAAVDVDDPDDVGDLVLDRMLGMQIDEGYSAPCHSAHGKRPLAVVSGERRIRTRPGEDVERPTESAYR
jgi:hypothetical protein